jgi:hypothetical protein
MRMSVPVSGQWTREKADPVIEKERTYMRSNRLMAWRDILAAARTIARGSVALVLASLLSGGRASADPIAIQAGQSPTRSSAFTLDFGAQGGVASARISQTDFALEIDADRGTAQFAQYKQFVDPLVLPGGFNTGAIRVEVVPGSSQGAFNALTGEFNTSELYAVHFDGDLSMFNLTSPVVLPSTSSGTLTLTALTGGDVIMAWTGVSQLLNPFDPSTYIPFSYTCEVTASFAPEPVSLLQLALIPEVINMSLPVGIETSFVTKLQTALDSVNAGRNRNAANALGAFLNKVEAQRGKKVSEADADALVSDAQATIMLLRTGHVAGSQTALDISPGRGGKSR